MKKILIAGATGLIGFKLARSLAESGYVVGGLTRNQKGVDRLATIGVQGIIANALNLEQLDAAVGSFLPNVFINQLTDLKSFDLDANTKIRVIGSKNITKVIKKYNVNKLIVQSISWMNGEGDGLVVESESLDAKAIGDRKTILDGVVALENETRKTPNHVILRFGYLYGPNTWFDFNGYYYNLYKTGDIQVSTGKTSYTHVDDAANISHQALEFESGTYFAVDDQPFSGIEFSKYYQTLTHGPKLQQTEPEYWERGQSNKKFKENGGTLIYPSILEGMKYLENK